MWKKRLVLLVAAAGGMLIMSLPVLSTAAKGKPKALAKDDGRETCYGCHEEVKSLKEGSKHARLACDLCHQKLKEHLDNSDTWTQRTGACNTVVRAADGKLYGFNTDVAGVVRPLEQRMHLQGAKALVLFHHDPDRSDGGIDQLVERAGELWDGASGTAPVAAAEGMTLEL